MLQSSSGEMGYAVENANIDGPDIMSRNGVVHIINRVLMPPSQSFLDVVMEPEFRYICMNL